MSIRGPADSVQPTDQDADIAFDANGVHRLALTIGHRTQPEGKKRWRWKCYVRPDTPSVIEKVVFDVQDGLGGNRPSCSAPPYEYGATTACVYTSLQIIVVVHYKVWLNRAPSQHAHSVDFFTAARGRRGVPLDGNERCFDEVVLLKHPSHAKSSAAAPAAELQWHEYEAPPGQYIAKPTLPERASLLSGSWAASAAADRRVPPGALSSSPPPHPSNVEHYPPLGGSGSGCFSLGRSPSFSSALLAAAAHGRSCSTDSLDAMCGARPEPSQPGVRVRASSSMSSLSELQQQPLERRLGQQPERPPSSTTARRFPGLEPAPGEPPREPRRQPTANGSSANACLSSAYKLGLSSAYQLGGGLDSVPPSRMPSSVSNGAVTPPPRLPTPPPPYPPRPSPLTPPTAPPTPPLLPPALAAAAADSAPLDGATPPAEVEISRGSSRASDASRSSAALSCSAHSLPQLPASGAAAVAEGSTSHDSHASGSQGGAQNGVATSAQIGVPPLPAASSTLSERSTSSAGLVSPSTAASTTAQRRHPDCRHPDYRHLDYRHPLHEASRSTSLASSALPSAQPSAHASIAPSRQPSRDPSYQHLPPPMLESESVGGSSHGSDSHVHAADADADAALPSTPDALQMSDTLEEISRRRREETQFLASVAEGDNAAVLTWLEYLGLSEHKDKFQQEARYPSALPPHASPARCHRTLAQRAATAR